MHEGDAILIHRCLRRDETAWRELVEKYQRLVYSIPRGYRLSDSVCDDVFQSVFALLYQNLASLHDTRTLAKWLITTTRRECWRIGQANARSSARESELYASDMANDAPPPEELERWEQRIVVQRALSRLGGPCEALLRALFMGQQRPNYAEISARLGIRQGSVGPTRARCLEKLAATLGIERNDPPAIP